MYPEADREFASAIDADPACALAYWGRAMTLIHPLWPDAPTEAERKQGAELIRLGLACPPATPRERAYLETLDRYFNVQATGDHVARLKVLDVELSQPLQMLRGLDGYGAVLAIVRWHGVPVGGVDVEVTNGVCTPAMQREAILRELSGDLLAFAHDVGSPVTDASLRATPFHELDVSAPAPYEGPWPSLTVAVCTRDRTSDLAQSLDALVQLDYPDLDLVVVDNAPSNDATEPEIILEFLDETPSELRADEDGSQPSAASATEPSQPAAASTEQTTNADLQVAAASTTQTAASDLPPNSAQPDLQPTEPSAAPDSQPTAASTTQAASPDSQPAAADSEKPKDRPSKPPAVEPIRTLTIARVLARQGYYERSLSIYDALLKETPDDAELRAEADRVRADEAGD